MASSSSSSSSSVAGPTTTAGKGLAAKLTKLRQAPKALTTIIHGSTAFNSILGYTGHKIIQDIDKYLVKDAAGNGAAVKPTPLVDFIHSLGICLIRIIGIRLNRWGKFEVQSKEALDLLNLQKASPEEKNTLSWTPIPVTDEHVVEFLQAKLASIPSQETGNTTLDPKDEFYIKVNEVTRGKLYNGAYPLFASYQVIQVNYPKEKSAASGETKKRKERPAGGAEEEGAAAAAATPKPKRGKKGAAPPPPPAESEMSLSNPEDLVPDIFGDDKSISIGVE